MQLLLYTLDMRIAHTLLHSEEFVSSSKEDCSSSDVGIASFGSLFHELGFNIQADVISEWLDNDANDSGVQIFTDSEICEFVSKSPSDPQIDSEEENETSEEPSKCPVSHSEAARMFKFEQCLSWLEYQPEASAYNTSVLRQLHTLSASKTINTMRQTKLSAFFQT